MATVYRLWVGCNIPHYRRMAAICAELGGSFQLIRRPVANQVVTTSMRKSGYESGGRSGFIGARTACG